MLDRNRRFAFAISLLIISLSGESLAEEVNLSQILGWQPCDNLCLGKFNDLDEVADADLLKTTEITAEKPTFLGKELSVFQGNVILKQPGRRLEADQVLLTLGKGRKLLRGEVSGKVLFREKGRFISAKRGVLDFKRQEYFLHEGFYRLKTGSSFYIWGKVEKAEYKPQHLWLTKGTISTCSPVHPSWQLKGEKIHFDFEKKVGSVKHAVLYLREVPVLYTPYYQFMLQDRRKSGLLWSVPYYTVRSGYIFGLPLYLNLAPNYDWLFKPLWMTRRGLFFENSVRYLTKRTRGRLFLGNIFHDRQFGELQANWKLLTKTNYSVGIRLKNSCLDRFGASWEHHFQINPFWQSSWRLNYASDDYFTSHFERLLNQSGERDQLLNRISLKYRDDQWQFLAKLEAFQTLHPILYGENEEQFRRLPQLTLDYSNLWRYFNYGFNSDLVFFQKRAYGEDPYVSSARGYFEPFLQFQKHATDFWRIDASVRIWTNLYQIWQYRPYDKPVVINTLPSLVLRQTLKFERPFTRLVGFKQTLEPSFAYHFIPYRNQDNIPLFDTFLPNLECDQLLRENRFVGKDRFGDSNQLVFSVTSRFLDSFSFERLNFKLVQVYAFQKHRVRLEGYSEDPLLYHYISPLCLQVRGNFTPQLSIILDSAWNIQKNRINTLRFTGKYAYSPDQVFNFWYHYGKRGDQYRQDNPIDLHRVGFAGSLNLFGNWQLIGKINYNLSFRRLQDYFAGLSYNGCCWSARFIIGQDFIGVGSDFSRNYDTKIYLQISLKGLTSIEARDIKSLIRQDIPNYHDQLFKWQENAN